eukprot:scaffold250639_cov36-Tisochrysis_lutea.AAC.1
MSQCDCHYEGPQTKFRRSAPHTHVAKSPGASLHRFKQREGRCVLGPGKRCQSRCRRAKAACLHL